jgi:hypothetical protein
MSEEPEKLTFTQAEFDNIIGERVLRERDKNAESYNLLTAENGLLKGKLAEIEIISLVKEAGLAPEWSQKLTGKTPEEVKAEVQTIKTLVEKSRPIPEPIGSDTNPANVMPVFITRESIKKMSPQEINDNWAAVQKALKSGI